MPTYTINHLGEATGQTRYAIPITQSLANWTTARVQLVEAASPNQGRYSASVTDANPHAVFDGVTQPTDWTQALDVAVPVVLAFDDAGAAVANAGDAMTLTVAYDAAKGVAGANKTATGFALQGSGALPWTINVKSSGGTPIPGVGVWVTTDLAGTNVVAGTLVTDAFGQVTFNLDAGDYYFWRQLSGYKFTNPQTGTVI